jgi:hypothetical protein
MIMAFHTTLLIPHRFNAYLEVYGRGLGDRARYRRRLRRQLFRRNRAAAAHDPNVAPCRCREWTERRAKLAAHSGWKAFRAAQAESIGSEFERLFKPAPSIPVKNLTSADEFVEMRVYRSHTGVINRFLEIYAAEGLPVQLRHLGNCIGYFLGSTAASTRVLSCILRAMPISTIGSSDARRYSPTRLSNRSW